MQKINLPTPPIGLEIKISNCDLTRLNSNLPVIRIIFDHMEKAWVVIPPTQKRGFIVFFIGRESGGFQDLPNSFTATLYKVTDTCGFARLSDN